MFNKGCIFPSIFDLISKLPILNGMEIGMEIFQLL